MNKPKAILCLDIDGTLIDNHEKVHPDDVQILQHFPESIQPVITTGRILHSAKGVLQESGLSGSGNFPLPGVFLNGGVAYLPDEILCTKHSFPSTTRTSLIDLACAFPKTAFTYFSLEMVYLVNPTPFGRHIASLHHLAAIESSPYKLPLDIIKVMVLEDDAQVLKHIQQYSQRLTAEKAYSLPHAYEINPKGVHKANTLMTLLTNMQMNELPVYVVGDAENDLSLFEIAHLSFTPATAHPSVIDRADHVIQRETKGILSPILAQIKNN